MRVYERYVAIGDSTVEGLDDPDGHGGYRGWANRLAERLAALEGHLLYANLGVRGRTTREVRKEQLGPALAMRPDLAAVVSGTNDVLRRNFDVRAFGDDVRAMQSALVDQGADVLTFTLPDLTPVMPFARVLGSRVLSMNDAIREACTRSGAILCDLAAHAVASDPRVWSEDRLHANSDGHARIADALAYHLRLPGSSLAWSEPLPSRPPNTLTAMAGAELRWTARFLVPWLVRHAFGKSSGDGRGPKRPDLTPVASQARAAVQCSSFA
jgi:lysophospholipase L1-like esterase